MEKVSQEDVLKLAAEAPAIIRKLASERDEAVTKLAAMEQRKAVEKLASQMHEKGINSHVPLDDLATQLEGWAAQGKLAEVQRAVEFVGPDMGQKIATVTHDDVGDGNGADGGELVRFLLGG